MQLPNKLPYTEHDLNIFTAHTTNQRKRRPENALLLALLFWVVLSGNAAPKTPEIQNNFKPSPVAIAYRLSSSKISSSSNRTSAAAGRQHYGAMRHVTNCRHDARRCPRRWRIGDEALLFVWHVCVYRLRSRQACKHTVRWRWTRLVCCPFCNSVDHYLLSLSVCLSICLSVRYRCRWLERFTRSDLCSDHIRQFIIILILPQYAYNRFYISKPILFVASADMLWHRIFVLSRQYKTQLCVSASWRSFSPPEFATKMSDAK